MNSAFTAKFAGDDPANCEPHPSSVYEAKNLHLMEAVMETWPDPEDEHEEEPEPKHEEEDEPLRCTSTSR